MFSHYELHARIPVPFDQYDDNKLVVEEFTAICNRALLNYFFVTNPMFSSDDTIFALSTPAGRSAVALIRMSGPASRVALEALTRKTWNDGKREPRKAYLMTLFEAVAEGNKSDPAAETIDEALVIFFKEPYSFTGEDMAEFQCHGSPAVIEKLTGQLSLLPGVRPALPGEFSRRAFDQGKLDLIEVEGLDDLLQAETEVQRQRAMGLAAGSLSGLYLSWRRDLIKTLAHLEALIDFPEENLPEKITQENENRIKSILKRTNSECDSSKLNQAIQTGISVVIIGAPNSGKSSLLNGLARRDVAIVTDIEGTTRDLLEIKMELGGYPIILTDTAGIRPTDDPIETIGIERTRTAASESVLLVALFDTAALYFENTEEASAYFVKEFSLERRPDLIIGSRVDLCTQEMKERIETHFLTISTHDNESLKQFESSLTELIKSRFDFLLENPGHTRMRHYSELLTVREALNHALSQELPELSAESLRTAIAALDRLVGKSDVEDILDDLFADFCIGK